MRMKLCALVQVLVATRFVTCLEDTFSDSNEFQEANSNNHQQQQGSWAHWWSYDGISGPDYWNINKRWRLCSLGRKQSPVDIRTERLVYDHLLGPIHLNWSSSSSASLEDKHKQDRIRLRLLNSGRGLEAWLPEALSQSQLILSRGPLSYDYGLFKIELHSAPTSSSAGFEQQPGRHNRDAASTTNEQPRRNQGEEDDDEDEEVAPDYLRSGKSSEHLIDGRSFEAELQLHFYNKRLASSASEAQHLAGQDEGRPSLFATISVFLLTTSPTTAAKDGGSNGSSSSSSSAVDELMLNNLDSLANQGDSLELSLGREQLERLVPDRRHYITYQGSMNRPPCSESVDWIINNRPLRMDLSKFRALFEKLNTNQENIRPVKPLNRRLLRTTINNLYHQPASQFGLSKQHQLEGGSKKSHTNQVPVGYSNNNNIAVAENGPLNCSGREDLKQCQGKAKERFGSLGSCSMKPRYFYQLTYGGGVKVRR